MKYKIFHVKNGNMNILHLDIQSYDTAHDILKCMKLVKRRARLNKWSLVINDNEMYRIGCDMAEGVIL